MNDFWRRMIHARRRIYTLDALPDAEFWQRFQAIELEALDGLHSDDLTTEARQMLFAFARISGFTAPASVHAVRIDQRSAGA